MVNAGDHEEPKDPKFRPEGVNGGSRAGERGFLWTSLSCSASVAVLFQWLQQQ